MILRRKKEKLFIDNNYKKITKTKNSQKKKMKEKTKKTKLIY